MDSTDLRIYSLINGQGEWFDITDTDITNPRVRVVRDHRRGLVELSDDLGDDVMLNLLAELDLPDRLVTIACTDTDPNDTRNSDPYKYAGDL